MLYNPNAQTAIPTVITVTPAASINGRQLAVDRRDARQRAATAARLVSGRLQLVNPTAAQAAAMLRVSATAVRRITRRGKPAAKKPVDLTSAWRSASAADRLDFVRAIGTATVLDVAVIVEQQGA